jgi:hypothetical protein
MPWVTRVKKALVEAVNLFRKFVIMHNFTLNNMKWLQFGSTGHLNKLRKPVTY